MGKGSIPSSSAKTTGVEMQFYKSYEIAEYRVVKDVDWTFLRAGQEFTAYSVIVFDKEYVKMGISTMDHRYFSFILSVGLIERIFPEHYLKDQHEICARSQQLPPCDDHHRIAERTELAAASQL